MSIDKIVLGFSSLFPKIEFDVDIEVFGDKSEKYKILVSDFDFYMNDKVFKKINEGFRKKYPSVKYFCYYKNIKT